MNEYMITFYISSCVMGAIITFPKILNDRLTDEGARALADILDKVESSAPKNTLEISEERFERKLAQAETRLVRWIASIQEREYKWINYLKK